MHVCSWLEICIYLLVCTYMHRYAYINNYMHTYIQSNTSLFFSFFQSLDKNCLGPLRKAYCNSLNLLLRREVGSMGFLHFLVFFSCMYRLIVTCMCLCSSRHSDILCYNTSMPSYLL